MAKGARKSGTRNPELISGVRRFSRSAAQRKRAAYLHVKKGDTRTAAQKEAGKKKAAATVPADITRSRFYSADDVAHPLKHKKHSHKEKLRTSLTPGAIVIILAGRFRGKRVVLLKQLESGLLLVTGPYKINGVPLRRVNAAYVLATSTKIDVSKVDVSSIDDKFFVKPESKQTKNKEGKFIKEKKEKTPIPDTRKAAQSKVDGGLKSVIAATSNLEHYLKAKFSLTNGQKPHLLTF